jgi:hypothetical protein
VAPLLEDVLNRLSANDNSKSTLNPSRVVQSLVRESRRHLDLFRGQQANDLPDEKISKWVEACLDRRVITYAQSFSAVREFIRQHIEGRAKRTWRELAQLTTGEDSGSILPDQCELWSVREGHTSSVWRVELRSRAHRTAAVLGLNVARDQDSAKELLSTSQEMRRLHSLDPATVLGVLAEETVEIRSAGGQIRLPVVAVPWIERARELQVVRDTEARSGRFIAVDEFVPRHNGDPAGRQRASGQLLSPGFSEALWRDQLSCRVRLTRFDDDLTATTPFFEINEGDLVLDANVIKAISVSERSPTLPLGLWVLDLLCSSASDPDWYSLRIFWNRPSSAIEVLSSTLGAAGPRVPSVEVCLIAARQAGDRQCDHLWYSGDSQFPEVLRNSRAALRNVMKPSASLAI